MNLLQNRIKLVEVDRTAVIFVVLENQLITHIHGEEYTCLLEGIMHLSAINRRPSSLCKSTRDTGPQQQAEMLCRDPLELL